jgi:beta-glucosidase-like glycosyl hydrolase
LTVAAFVETVLAAVGALIAPAPGPAPSIETLTPERKAALVVVSGLPAPSGVAGVLVQDWSRDLPRPPGALVFVDQEGVGSKAFSELPPLAAASDYRAVDDAFAAGRATGEALRRHGVHVDLAPVLDASTGPLGSRHFREASLGVAFARGLAAGGAGACVKHFPGLGSARVSTDNEPRVFARVDDDELASFRAAIKTGVPCVMLSHALYDRFANERAVVSPGAYGLLRRMGFRGITITDSLSIVRGPWPARWARRAILAGADLVLFTSADDARRAIRALVPLARAGALDDQIERVRRFRASFGLATP